MKYLILGALGAFAIATPAYASPLIVELEGVRSAGGQLYVSVQRREQFMQESAAAGSVIAAPTAGSHRFSYDLPAGEYAVSVWHDDNGNGRFDKDENHMPLDGWAMTNAGALRGEPTFDQVRIVLGDAPANARLSMTYGR
ncbi:MAG TPA: DUF2141 domain-containing protein [Allosphingosinicella sp.]|jgi:uncharacterized protein (DUF2141 family)